MDDETANLISKYSSGVSILVRISGLWNDANTHSRTGRYADWNNDLDCIFRELARDLTDDEYGIKQKEFNKFDTDIAGAGKFMDGGSQTFKEPSTKQIDGRSKHYKSLNDKELFLKRLENKVGKGTTWDNGDEDDF